MNNKIITFFKHLVCLTSSVGCRSGMRNCLVIQLQGLGLMKKVTISDLDLNSRNGLYYKKYEDKPYTGDVEGQQQGKFKNGVKEGSWVFYDNNGKLMTKGFYKNGKKEGTWEYYHDGKLSEKGKFMNSHEEGFWEGYWEDGQLNYKGKFENGKKEGSWVWYHYNGQIMSQGHYENDNKVGYWVAYNEGGHLLEEET